MKRIIALAGLTILLIGTRVETGRISGSFKEDNKDYISVAFDNGTGWILDVEKGTDIDKVVTIVSIYNKDIYKIIK